MAETKLQRLNRSLAEELHTRIEADIAALRIPQGWHHIWREKDRRDERKTRITLTVDADVVRFFKAMGAGYQPRMNRVLRAFMHDRLAGLVAGPEDRLPDQHVAQMDKLVEELTKGAESGG